MVPTIFVAAFAKTAVRPNRMIVVQAIPLSIYDVALSYFFVSSVFGICLLIEDVTLIVLF